MKKLFLITPLFFILFLGSLNQVFAIGSFELIDQSDSLNATVGKEFKSYISFFYSGDSYYPEASFVGTTFPEGLKLGSVTNDGNSLYNILYSGIPKNKGNYSLILKLTDNNGALLTKKINVKVSGLEFTNTTLPHAVINTPYSYSLFFSYPIGATDTPRLTFYNIPQGVILTPNLNPNAQSGQYFELKLLAYKTGEHILRSNVTLDGVVLGSQNFTLVVDEKQTSLSQESVIVKQTEITNNSENVNKVEEKETLSRNKNFNSTEIKKQNNNDTLPIKNSNNISSFAVESESIKKIKWYKKAFNWVKSLF